METLAAQPPTHHKEQNIEKSFDVLASVDLMRFDLQRFGQVLPETRRRVYDEELSSIAEGAERASRTEFVLAREDSDLVYFDRGKWRSYTGMLLTGQRVAHKEAEQDTRRTFLAEWADRDLRIGYQLRKLQPGEAMNWINSYPHDQERHHGTKFMQECGLFPRRKMGFIYRAECLEDGNIVLESQTVDGSYEAAFAAVDAYRDQAPEADMDTLVAAYDEAAVRITGQAVYAGRTEAMRQENAWHEIRKHHDLIAAMLDGLETIAATNVPRPELRRQTERHIIGVWKAFKLRLDKTNARTAPARPCVPSVPNAQAEILRGYALARAQGDIKIGCGGAIIAATEANNEPVNAEATFDAIFGDKSTNESRGSWKWKEGVCRVPECSTRPGKTKVGPCEVCVRCQAMFDAGQDPTRLKAVSNETDTSQKYDASAEIAKLWKKFAAAEIAKAA